LIIKINISSDSVSIGLYDLEKTGKIRTDYKIAAMRFESGLRRIRQL
jgi:hypothetical protein